ncbi:MAG: sensor histidine kinase [Actinomycetia bacterium]|nr:sensor histidine kinase [Actinomycetes bacterium]
MSLSNPQRSFLIDSAMAIAMFLLALLSLLGLPDFFGGRPIDALGIVLIAAQTLSLAWRRRFPIPVLVIVVGAFVIDRGLDYPSSWAVFGMAFALYTVGAEIRVRTSRIVAVSTIVVIVAWTVVGVVSYGLPAPVIVTIAGFATFPYVLGREARRREQRALDLEARAIRAEFDHERQAAAAVQEERTRIARELHDAVAHEVTVMTIQAAAANRVLDDDPDEARAAMAVVEDSGRRALIEMRRLLGLLRTEAEHDLAPLPGLDALDALIEQLEDAGLNVQLNVEGTPRALPPGVDVNAYRIVQESLTNTVKHAGPGAQADVRVAFGAADLRIEVSDDGCGAAGALTSNGAGHGLIGMRERVTLLDGSLQTGPMTGGGYRVLATIPLEPIR